MNRETRRRRWRRVVRLVHEHAGEVRRGGPWEDRYRRPDGELAGRLRALPDAQLAALIWALPNDGVEALAALVFALRDVRERKEKKQ